MTFFHHCLAELRSYDQRPKRPSILSNMITECHSHISDPVYKPMFADSWGRWLPLLLPLEYAPATVALSLLGTFPENFHVNLITDSGDIRQTVEKPYRAMLKDPSKIPGSISG